MLAQHCSSVLSTALNSLVAFLKIWSTKSAKKRHLCASISAHSLHRMERRKGQNNPKGLRLEERLDKTVASKKIPTVRLRRKHLYKCKHSSAAAG